VELAVKMEQVLVRNMFSPMAKSVIGSFFILALTLLNTVPILNTIAGALL
jgi:hypothetical protein